MTLITQWTRRAASAVAFLLAASTLVDAALTEVLLLSGTGNDDTVDWGFRINGGRQSGEWSTIPVPSNWEMEGFGTYHYGKDWGEHPAPDSFGEYRHQFQVPEEWEGMRVDIVVGAAMTDAEVFINGQLAGPVHQGGFYQFSYEITERLRFGSDNLLEMKVHKYSANESVNLAEREADYWLFGGIFRPVWLEARPATHIDRLAVNARHDGSLAVDVYLDGLEERASVVATVRDAEGNNVLRTTPVPVEVGDQQVRITGVAEDAAPWSAEWPHLYRLEVMLEARDGSEIHREEETIGFRTVKLRPRDGLYVNGERVTLKGVNRHSIWPESGRTTNVRLSEADVRLMKEMNMNAVRMSHYPPDSHFLEACDRLGLYVIDELGGWQKSYDSEVGPRLVRETVVRDVNHPSVILWANGNEGGWNTDLDDDFAIHDPQDRPVIHPWSNFNGINTSHYENYDSGPNWFFHGEDLIMPTEFLHGLYDGGHGAGLDDWWKLILSHPLGVGGFLWAFADEGIVRDDEGGRIDVAGNRAPDGIVGPYRQREGSFFTIKEIWAPIYLPRTEVDTLPASFDGRLRIENRYSFTNLDQLTFEWKLLRYSGKTLESTRPEVTARGELSGPGVEPSLDGYLQLDLPRGWHENDTLSLAAFGPDGNEIYTWKWMLTDPSAVAQRYVPAERDPARVEQTDASIVLRSGAFSAEIDRSTGRLSKLVREGVESSLRNGPILLEGEAELESLDVNDGIVTATYAGALQSVTWDLLASGWLRMHYLYYYRHYREVTYFGVTFAYDEKQVDGLRWLGKGPYRVWKNRGKGVEFGLWQKAYNDTATGESWTYPEFKGFHDDVYWAQIQSDIAPLEMVIASPDIHLRLFTPREGSDPANTRVEFPPGDLSFLHTIAPIGTKFKTADMHGPAGQPSWPHRGGQIFTGTVYLRIGETAAADR